MVKQQSNYQQSKVTQINFSDSPGGSIANFNTGSITYVDVTGMSFTYTSGPSIESLILHLDGMIGQSTANGGCFVRLVVNGVALKSRYLQATGSWLSVYMTRNATIPANTAAVIKVQMAAPSGVTVTWNRDQTNDGYYGAIYGFATGV